MSETLEAWRALWRVGQRRRDGSGCASEAGKGMKQRPQMPAVGEECCFNVTHAKWCDATCLQSYEGSGRITCATKAGPRYF